MVRGKSLKNSFRNLKKFLKKCLTSQVKSAIIQSENEREEIKMTIYVDNGETVKIYPVKAKVAKAVMTLLETDDELIWYETHPGYGVAIVDKEEREE